MQYLNMMDRNDISINIYEKNITHPNSYFLFLSVYLSKAYRQSGQMTLMISRIKQQVIIQHYLSHKAFILPFLVAAEQ